VRFHFQLEHIYAIRFFTP